MGHGVMYSVYVSIIHMCGYCILGLYGASAVGGLRQACLVLQPLVIFLPVPCTILVIIPECGVLYGVVILCVYHHDWGLCLLVGRLCGGV